MITLRGAALCKAGALAVATLIALSAVMSRGTTPALATSGTMSLVPSTTNVFEGASFTVSIMQNTSVASSGAQADFTFDQTHMQITALDRGTAYPGPDGTLNAGISPQTIGDAITEANATGTLKNAAVFYSPPAGEPTVPASPPARESMKITLQATTGVNALVALGLANAEMLDANGATISVTTSGASVTVHHEDGDGCLDTKELGPSHLSGGQRNPSFQWDFYDVNNTHKVDSVDIAIVRSKFNLHTGDPGYATTFDRTAGAAAWAPGPPNGVINAVDIGLVRAEFNDNCN